MDLVEYMADTGTPSPYIGQIVSHRLVVDVANGEAPHQDVGESLVDDMLIAKRSLQNIDLHFAVVSGML